MWSAIVTSATKRDGRWWCTTAGPKGASLPWARGRWSCGCRGSTIAGAMSTASASALVAASCRPTCGVRPRWPKYCPFSICADSPPGDFRPALEGVAGRGRGRAVADQHHTAYRLLGERIHGVWPARPHGPRVRLRVGRWGAFQHPARRRAALHPGDDRRAARRREGVARGRGRLPGERRELEDAAARAQAARAGRAGGGGGRRRAGVLGCDARGLARDPRAGLLVSQARQRARQVAPTASAPRQTRAPRDDVRRVPHRLRGCTIAFRSGVSGQVPQGGRVADCQLGAPGYFLRLPRRALEALAYDQCDRVAVRHRALARARDQGRRFKNQGTADGVQVARHGAASLAAPRWRSAIAAGSCRREVRGWSSPGSTEKLYSLKRRPTEGSRLITTGRSTTFDNYSVHFNRG